MGAEILEPHVVKIRELVAIIARQREMIVKLQEALANVQRMAEMGLEIVTPP